eukprot:CAMPEP_0173344556 /NCGR_PEP_ID=MMETSP1144-20121109/11455_1 /TAXON_ID=483371 /ORGANISM="non described non described, Strain CCMP2298" /LENGTH=98 /DNA_ID=CAMNT_0014291527 /DNA_START=163 /DNA_END=459 /DNA_ORIENTATION=-
MALLARAVHDNDSTVWISHDSSSPANASAYPEELALLGADGALDIIFDSGASGHFLPTKTPMFNYKVMEGKVRLVSPCPTMSTDLSLSPNLTFPSITL